MRRSRDKTIQARVPKNVYDALDKVLPHYDVPTRFQIMYDFSAVRLENYLKGGKKGNVR